MKYTEIYIRGLVSKADTLCKSLDRELSEIDKSLLTESDSDNLEQICTTLDKMLSDMFARSEDYSIRMSNGDFARGYEQT